MKLKKLLSAIIAGAMVLGTMSIPAFADTCEAKVGEEKMSLADAFGKIGSVAKGETITIDILKDVDLTGKDWTPAYTSAYITINGNNHTITGLSAPLLGTKINVGGWDIVFKDITIDKANIAASSECSGRGAFIGNIENVNSLEFNNCHVKNSTIKSTKYAGGLYGYAGLDPTVSGGGITVKSCSVTNSTIESVGSAGGIAGHMSGGKDFPVVISGTTVTGNTIKCTETGSTNKAGAICGTIGTSPMSVSATVSGNTVTSDTATITTVYGRNSNDSAFEITGGSYDAKPFYDTDAYAKLADGLSFAEGTFNVVDPNAVAKVGTDTYTSFDAALAAAENNGTVTLLKDTTIGALKIGKSLNVDLGGYTLKITAGAGANNSVNGDVKIYNGKIDCSGVANSANGIINVGFSGCKGTYSLTLKDIELVANNITGGAFLIYVDDQGTNSLELDNVTATVRNSAMRYVFGVNYTEEYATIKNSHITIDTITHTDGAGVFQNFNSIENTVILIKDVSGHAVRNTKSLEIKNSQITVDGCETGVKIDNGGKLTVKNSVIDVKNPQAGKQCFILTDPDVDNKSVLTSSDTSAASYSNTADVLVSTQNIASAAESDTENSTVGFSTTIAPKSAATVLKGVRWTVTANGRTKTKEFDINNISGEGTTKLGLIITNIDDANATATAEAITATQED